MTPVTDITKIKEPTPPQTPDKQAKQEEKNWTSLRGEQDGKHGVILDNNLFWIACVAIWVLFCLFLILLIIWFWHLVTPTQAHWLKQPELQAVERILFASTIVSLAGKYFSKFKLLDKHE
jgi:hypothetical protein